MDIHPIWMNQEIYFLSDRDFIMNVWEYQSVYQSSTTGNRPEARAILNGLRATGKSWCMSTMATSTCLILLQAKAHNWTYSSRAIFPGQKHVRKMLQAWLPMPHYRQRVNAFYWKREARNIYRAGRKWRSKKSHTELRGC